MLLADRTGFFAQMPVDIADERKPLLGTPGYEPTALGMRIAKPFVTTFASVNGLTDLVHLSRTVHLRS